MEIRRESSPLGDAGSDAAEEGGWGGGVRRFRGRDRRIIYDLCLDRRMSRLMTWDVDFVLLRVLMNERTII